MKTYQQEECLKKLSRKIISRRYEMKMSQSALSEKVDCKLQHLSRIERCEVDPSYTMVLRLAEALEIPAQELIV